MASSAKTYLKQLQKQFNYRATWEPNKPMSLGAIGKLHQGVFVEYSTLEKEGIPVESTSSTDAGTMEYSSEGGVSITTKASGQASPQAAALGEVDAGIIIAFSKKNAVVFKANNTTNHKLVNLREIEKAVLDRFNRGEWDKDYVVVTELIEAESASAIVSKSNDSKIEFKADGSVGIEKLDVADASLGLQVVAERDIALSIVGKQGLQPLYQIMGIRTKFLSNEPSGITVIKKNEISESENLFEEIPFQEQELDPEQD